MRSNEKIDIRKVKVISFDLDNTLYDNSPVIKKAEAASQKFLCDEFEKQNLKFDRNHFISIRKNMVETNNIEFDNLTLLRQECLRQVCAGLHNSEPVVKKATEIFIQLRQEASIPNKIEQMISLLSKKFQLVSITNGNCDANNLSIGQHFTKNYSPEHGFRAKPHAEMFETVFRDFNINPSELLHVGDERKSDELGAINADCQFYLLTPFLNESKLDTAVDDFISIL